MLRRRSLTVLQFLGIAFGVAATVGIVLSARAAMAGFSRRRRFPRGTGHAFDPEARRPDGRSDPGPV